MRTKPLLLSLALCPVLLVVGTVVQAAAAASLVVTLVSGPTEAFLNQTIPVAFRVKNDGNETSEAYEVELYLSRDRTIKPAVDRLLKKVSFPNGLAPGQARKTTTSVTIPIRYLPGLAGSYYYGAAVGSSKKASLTPVVIHRYQNNGDGTVTDFKTGLMWQKADDGIWKTWPNAKTYCNQLELAGHDDWSLPTIGVLETIIDYTKFGPAINSVFDCQSSLYWTATACAHKLDYAWHVDFGNGSSGASHTEHAYNYVRCVREGP